MAGADLGRIGFPSFLPLIQRPILLSGHERSLNQIKYNREGDLLFSVSKDNVVCAWFSHNGERLGTYEGHNGTVWTVDVDGECPDPPLILDGIKYLPITVQHLTDGDSSFITTTTSSSSSILILIITLAATHVPECSHLDAPHHWLRRQHAPPLGCRYRKGALPVGVPHRC